MRDIEEIVSCRNWIQAKYITYAKCSSIIKTLIIIHLRKCACMFWLVHLERETKMYRRMRCKIWKLSLIMAKSFIPTRTTTCIYSTTWQTAYNCLNGLKYFYLAPTSNVCDVLEELLQQVFPWFNESTNVLVITSSIYRRVGYENDTPFCEQLQQKRGSPLPAGCVDNLNNGIEICTLGSVQCDFPFHNAEL